MSEQPTLEPSVTTEAIDQIVHQLNEQGVSEVTLSKLRSAWPDCRFILCSEDDMYGKEAYLKCEGFEIFLMAASMGCASLTRTPENAIGLIIAEIEPDL